MRCSRVDFVPIGESSLRKQLTILAASYPAPSTGAGSSDDFMILVEEVLASQATPASVKTVLPRLSTAYPTVSKLAAADVEAVESLLVGLPLHHQKAKNLVAMAHRIVDAHGGNVPRDLDTLVRLTGVGRRIGQQYLARVASSDTLPINTHTHRVARRLGWTNEDNLRRAESEVHRHLHGHVTADFATLAHRMSEHARNICTPRRPRCGDCDLFDVCPSAGSGS
jgi:endonuclease-3